MNIITKSRIVRHNLQLRRRELIQKWCLLHGYDYATMLHTLNNWNV